MHWLLQDFMLLDPWDQLLSIIFSLSIALIALAGACNEQVFTYDGCLCAFLVLVTLFSFSVCCILLHTIIVAKCLSLGPFSVLPLPPCPDFDSVEPLVVSNSRRVLCIPPNVGKNQEEGKCPIDYLSFRNSFAKVNWYGRDGYYSRNISDTVRMLGFELYISEDEFGSGVSPHARKVESASRVKASPAEPTDEVDLLCEQFAAMHFGASAQASAYVQHQDEPSSLVPADTVSGAVGMPSLEDDADANSLAYQHSTPSSSTGRSFPDCDVEMGDSIFEDSNQIPSAAVGEVGPVAMDIMGDSLSMDNHAQEQRQQQYSSAGPHATVALHTAAALAFMSRAQEQSLPEEHTPVYGADDYSVSDSGQEVIAAAAAVEDSEHVQDVGDSTASDALALAIAANMLPSLEQSNITTVGNASLVDVSSDFPTMTEAATLVEESNDEVGGEEGEEGEEEDPAVVPDALVAAPSARGVKRGREATDDGTFSTEDGEYASVARRRVDEGDSDSTDHGQSEEVRVGDDELENDDEAALLPPPQTTPPPTVDDVLAEILDESDEDFYS